MNTFYALLSLYRVLEEIFSEYFSSDAGHEAIIRENIRTIEAALNDFLEETKCTCENEGYDCDGCYNSVKYAKLDEEGYLELFTSWRP